VKFRSREAASGLTCLAIFCNSGVRRRGV
jgi:hypothetical protein